MGSRNFVSGLASHQKRFWNRFDRWQKMCGKAIPGSDDTYLTTVQLREKFVQLKRMLTIQQLPKAKNSERFVQLETTIEQLQRENVSTKTVAEVMTKRVNELEDKLKEATDEIWQLSLQVQPLVSWYDQYKSILEEIRRQEKAEKKLKKNKSKT